MPHSIIQHSYLPYIYEIIKEKHGIPSIQKPKRSHCHCVKYNEKSASGEGGDVGENEHQGEVVVVPGMEVIIIFQNKGICPVFDLT